MMMNDPHHEVEDFEETVSFESGQFAIVDAEVVKSLKDKIPLADQAIFVATKQSRGSGASFKVTAEYDDATLRRLIIEPAVEDSHIQEPVEESFEGRQVETRKSGGVQLQGKGGDVVQRKTRKHDRKGGKSRPKSAERSTRNKKGSAKGDQMSKLTKGKSSAEQRVDAALGLKGGARGNFGQPRSTVEGLMAKESGAMLECMEILVKAKKEPLTEDYLNSLKHSRAIRQVLASVRDKGLISGKSFDLVYEVVQKLDEHWHKSACGWVENIKKEGFNV